MATNSGPNTSFATAALAHVSAPSLFTPRVQEQRAGIVRCVTPNTWAAKKKRRRRANQRQAAAEQEEEPHEQQEEEEEEEEEEEPDKAGGVVFLSTHQLPYVCTVLIERWVQCSIILTHVVDVS